MSVAVRDREREAGEENRQSQRPRAPPQQAARPLQRRNLRSGGGWRGLGVLQLLAVALPVGDLTRELGVLAKERLDERARVGRGFAGVVHRQQIADDISRNIHLRAPDSPQSSASRARARWTRTRAAATLIPRACPIS